MHFLVCFIFQKGHSVSGTLVYIMSLNGLWENLWLSQTLIHVSLLICTARLTQSSPVQSDPSVSFILTAVLLLSLPHLYLKFRAERTASRPYLELERVTWPQNGGGSRQCVSQASLTLRDTQAHTHDLKPRADDRTVPQPWWWVHWGSF